MRRIPWEILLALLAGLGLGLVYSWVVSPPRIVDAEPVVLRADFKDQYRSAIAAAYNATGNLPRARARLSLLGDRDSIVALNAQAQRMLGSGEQFESADQVAALALALDDKPNSAPISTPTIEFTNNVEDLLTATSPPPPSDAPIVLTETPEIIEVEPTATVSVATPRPTRTLVPTLGAPFALTGQETLCDSNLPDGLLQVLVLNPNRRQLAGVEIVVTWDGGKEQFFTGLKPELGNGYADYIMAPDITYTIQLARGSDVALGIVAPGCQTSSGENFFGGIKLTFQQP
ncbi:MAG: hypothetical protein EHM40_11140 [Chloroflexi bacterium]|nr:MAG: hypothetical protein EHM40_11140 [Chloroflexota bacterium]